MCPPKNPSRITFPAGFESQDAREAKKAAEKNRIAVERELRTKRERDFARKEETRREAFYAFWNSLSPPEQEAFEREALNAAEPTKRTGYLRAMGEGTGPVFEQYRLVILRDQFESLRSGEAQEAPKSPV